jgi:hypothetical protein
MNEFRETEDYYILDDGRLVFTASYLLRRGFCCGNGCMNCPYDFINVPEPVRTKLLQQREANKKTEDS